MKVEIRSIESIYPYEKNPRVNDDAVDAVARSIREYGFRQPIVIDAEGVIICGHTRYKAALRLGMSEVPVHVVKDLPPEKIRAYRIADNKTHDIAHWDDDALRQEIEALLRGNIIGEDLGFLPEELDELLREIEEEIEISSEPAFQQGVQVEPEDEFIVIVCKKGMEETHEEIRKLLNLSVVRRGGYKPGKAHDITEPQRVLTSGQFMEVLNAYRCSK